MHEASRKLVEHVEIPARGSRSSSAIGVRTSRQATHHDQAPQHSRTPTAAHAHVASMAADPTDDDQQAVTTREAGNGTDAAQHVDDHAAEDDDEEEEDDDDDADEEPKLKYSRLTSSLGPVYRNGDATSSFLVAGDKMVWF